MSFTSARTTVSVHLLDFQTPTNSYINLKNKKHGNVSSELLIVTLGSSVEMMILESKEQTVLI